MALVSHHKIKSKKSKSVKIGQNGSKYAFINLKMAIFVKKAAIRHVYWHFHGPSNILLKLSDFADFIS